MSVLVQIVLTAGAAALVWFGWEEIRILRGTWFDDLRLFLFLLFVFFVFSLAQWIANRITALFGGRGGG